MKETCSSSGCLTQCEGSSAAGGTMNRNRRGQRNIRSLNMTNHGLTPRHLALMNISTPEEWIAKAKERDEDRATVERLVLSKDTPGHSKLAIRSEYIVKYGKTLFSCPHCWLLPGLCICGRLEKVALQNTSVICSVHNLEWGKASNSGAIASLSCEGGQVLLRGHVEHDERLQAAFEDTSSTVAVLFPGESAISPSELKEIARTRTGGKITVIAVDATWRNAVRLKQSYPSSLLQVKLTAGSPIISNQSRSLLYPVRKYAGEESLGRSSTLEAVASLLVEIEGTVDARGRSIEESLLGNLRKKVDACCLQKSMSPPYQSFTEGDLIQTSTSSPKTRIPVEGSQDNQLE
jgi:DTW domain-containing protein YfiP